MLKNYKLHFDPPGLLLFLLIMLPNLLWFLIPAPNDVLRSPSVTPALDAFASVCQVLMVALLCAVIHRQRKPLRLTLPILGVVICCLLYFAGWLCYYIGNTSAMVMLGLTLPPCLAFGFFAIDRKNMLALVPCAVFTVCHLICAVANFML